MPSEEDQAQARQWLKYTGLGVEFAVITAGCGYLGYLADQRWQREPLGILLGLLIGLTAGIYQLWKFAHQLDQKE